MKLCQVIAIANGEKSKKQKVLSKVYQTLKKDTLFDGISKRYEPFEEDPTGSNALPPEDKNVQMTVRQAISEAITVMDAMFNIVATQDVANCVAKADVKVEGTVVVKDVPVTHLLFLEKQLNDIRTFVESFPTLDPAENWEMDNTTGSYKSEPKQTIRTKKVMKNHVKAEATDKHPAQVEIFGEDIPVGKWTTIKFSGCVKKKDKDTILVRIDALEQGLKMAREEANGIEVQKSNIGTSILNFIFG